MRLIKNDRLDFFFIIIIYLFILLINYFGLIKKKKKIKKKTPLCKKHVNQNIVFTIHHVKMRK
jgi:hypothetical protein